MLESLARIYLKMPDKFTKVIALMICICSTKQWIREDTSSPIIILIALQLFIIYPLISFIIGILSVFVSFICSIYVAYKESSRQTSWTSNHNKENYYEDNQENNRQYSYTYEHKKNELDEALNLYGLQLPFTEQDLRERRRQLMKKAHPDSGGNTKDAEKVNRYFEVLKNYVS